MKLYQVMIEIDKPIHRGKLIEAFGGKDHVKVTTSQKNGKKILKSVLLDETQINEFTTPQDLAQAIYDSHDFQSITAQELKDEKVSVLYEQMSKEIIDQMEITFGTRNKDSAAADKETWEDMEKNPSDWSGAGLKAKFDRGAIDDGQGGQIDILKDDPLDTDEKVTEYAKACNVAVKAYGVWRMQRKQQYSDERDATLNEGN